MLPAVLAVLVGCSASADDPEVGDGGQATAAGPAGQPLAEVGLPDLGDDVEAVQADVAVQVGQRSLVTLTAGPREVALVEVGPDQPQVLATRQVVPDDVDEVVPAFLVEQGQGSTMTGAPQEPTGERAASVELLASGDVVAAVVRVVDIGRDDVSSPVVADAGPREQESRLVLLRQSDDDLKPLGALSFDAGVVDAWVTNRGTVLLALASSGPVAADLAVDGSEGRQGPLLAGEDVRESSLGDGSPAQDDRVVTTLLAVDLAGPDPRDGLAATAVAHPSTDLVVDGGAVVLLDRPAGRPPQGTGRSRGRSVVMTPLAGSQDGPVPALRLDGPVASAEHVRGRDGDVLLARAVGGDGPAVERLRVEDGRLQVASSAQVPGRSVTALSDAGQSLVVATAPPPTAAPAGPASVAVLGTADGQVQALGSVEVPEPLTGLLELDGGRVLGAGLMADTTGVLTSVDVSAPQEPRLVSRVPVDVEPRLYDEPRAAEALDSGRALLPAFVFRLPDSPGLGPLLLVDAGGDDLVVQHVPVEREVDPERALRVGTTAVLVGRQQVVSAPIP